MIKKIMTLGLIASSAIAGWGVSIPKDIDSKKRSTFETITDSTKKISNKATDSPNDNFNWMKDRAKSETDRTLDKIQYEIDTLYGKYNDVKNGLTDAFYKQKRCIEAAEGRASTIEKCKADFIKDLKDEQQKYKQMEMDEIDKRKKEIPNEIEERLTFDDDNPTDKNTNISTPEEYDYVLDEWTTDDTTTDDTTTPVIDTYIDTQDDTYTEAETPNLYNAPKSAPRNSGISYSSNTRNNKRVKRSKGAGDKDELELKEKRCIERGGDFEICRESVLDSNNEDEKTSFFRERQ